MTVKQRKVLEQATQAWDMWEKFEKDQVEWVTKYRILASWPRDAYESWLDDLATNAKEALAEG